MLVQRQYCTYFHTHTYIGIPTYCTVDSRRTFSSFPLSCCCCSGHRHSHTAAAAVRCTPLLRLVLHSLGSSPSSSGASNENGAVPQNNQGRETIRCNIFYICIHILPYTKIQFVTENGIQLFDAAAQPRVGAKVKEGWNPLTVMKLLTRPAAARSNHNGNHQSLQQRKLEIGGFNSCAAFIRYHLATRDTLHSYSVCTCIYRYVTVQTQQFGTALKLREQRAAFRDINTAALAEQ